MSYKHNFPLNKTKENIERRWRSPAINKLNKSNQQNDNLSKWKVDKTT